MTPYPSNYNSYYQKEIWKGSQYQQHTSLITQCQTLHKALMVQNSSLETFVYVYAFANYGMQITKGITSYIAIWNNLTSHTLKSVFIFLLSESLPIKLGWLTYINYIIMIIDEFLVPELYNNNNIYDFMSKNPPGSHLPVF